MNRLGVGSIGWINAKCILYSLYSYTKLYLSDQ